MPRLLFISPQCLIPADAGGKIRSSDLLKGMRGRHFELGLVMPQPGNAPPLGGPAHETGLCDRFWSWPQRVTPSLPRRLLGLLGPLPLSVQLDDHPPAHAAIAQAIAEFQPDLVIYDFVHADVFRRPAHRQPAICLTHNVEAEIFARHARKAARLSERLVWTIETRKMRRFERSALNGYDAVVAISERDAEQFRQDYGVRQVASIPTGVDLDFFARLPTRAGGDEAGNRLVFVGAMDWRANLDGLTHFLEQVWPMIRRQRPDAELTIVGKHPPDSFRALAARAGNVSLTGWVEDVRPYVADADIFIVPLRVGGGTRLKIYEAFSMGRAVVSTTLGAEGLAGEHRTHFLRADEATDFAAGVVELMNDAALRQRIVANARQLVEARFGHHEVARVFESICIETLAAAPARR
jgi:glycosyltransferase involved in cell wall biosynthesis